MALNIRTFDNQKGSSCFFKALGHPFILPAFNDIINQLKEAPSAALLDPHGYAEDFMALAGLKNNDIDFIFVQAVEHLGQKIFNIQPKPITDLPQYPTSLLVILSFEPERLLSQIQHLLSPKCVIISLASLKLPQEMISNKTHYLSPLNFANNFAFFRESEGHHTRVSTINYWQRYGAQEVYLWLCLFDEQGNILAQWKHALNSTAHTIVLDSQEIKARFHLPDFTGQLFIHVIGAHGHDVVKYALDTYGDDSTVLSATHDTNAWPCDYFAGLPAPEAGETVLLWLQNSHPVAIPPHAIGLNLMGSEEVRTLPQTIAPFATYALHVSELFPEARWPQQLEVFAGKYFMRPRYEVVRNNSRRCMAHINVERTDLQPDPQLKLIGEYVGKGFILSAPILPLVQYISTVLPTPMARSQQSLPLEAILYASSGEEVGRHKFGRLPRNHHDCLTLNSLLEGDTFDKLKEGYGHVELVYDFTSGDEADGWLHGLFRYRNKHNGHQAETSFGSHIFNTLITYKNEPQSYTGRPPGLTTRLFLRLGSNEHETFCHLIYPVSKTWHPFSSTVIELYTKEGEKVAERYIQIPASGSLLWYYTQIFTEEERDLDSPYIIIVDSTCRLFGYHGVVSREGAFSLDHMFGF